MLSQLGFHFAIVLLRCVLTARKTCHFRNDTCWQLATHFWLPNYKFIRKQKSISLPLPF